MVRPTVFSINPNDAAPVGGPDVGAIARQGRRIEVRVIEDVKDFAAKLRFEFLVNRNVLDQ